MAGVRARAGEGGEKGRALREQGSGESGHSDSPRTPPGPHASTGAFPRQCESGGQWGPWHAGIGGQYRSVPICLYIPPLSVPVRALGIHAQGRGTLQRGPGDLPAFPNTLAAVQLKGAPRGGTSSHQCSSRLELNAHGTSVLILAFSGDLEVSHKGPAPSPAGPERPGNQTRSRLGILSPAAPGPASRSRATVAHRACGRVYGMCVGPGCSQDASFVGEAGVISGAMHGVLADEGRGVLEHLVEGVQGLPVEAAL